MKLSAAAILSLAGFASAETFLKEQFDDVSSFSTISTRNGPTISTTIKSDSPGHFFFQSDCPGRSSKRLHVVKYICCDDETRASRAQCNESYWFLPRSIFVHHRPLFPADRIGPPSRYSKMKVPTWHWRTALSVRDRTDRHKAQTICWMNTRPIPRSSHRTLLYLVLGPAVPFPARKFRISAANIHHIFFI